MLHGLILWDDIDCAPVFRLFRSTILKQIGFSANSAHTRAQVGMT